MAASSDTDEKKVMLIAGGTGSIGREIARQAVQEGWHVALHGRTTERLESAAKIAGPDQCTTFALDLTKEEAHTLVERVGARLGRIDAVVDCVSGGPLGIIGRFADTDPAAYAAFYDLSIAHLQRLTHASLPWLQKRGGTLIAFASDAGRFAAANQTMIGASRAAIMGFVRNLAVEVARDGVRAHCISPNRSQGVDAHRTGRTESWLGLAHCGRHRAARAVSLRRWGAPHHRSGHQRQRRSECVNAQPATRRLSRCVPRSW
jgi:NAD(P)-dependent dehydrogenase (short-subunit alcohol dehydrogenase family)